MLLFAYILPGLSANMEAAIDVVLLVLTTSPAIYFGVIRPYIVANTQLLTRINNLAFLDELTQLGNRRALAEYFDRFSSMNIRHNSYGALMCLDLDLFKEINDTFGHDAGDTVLSETAKRLNAVVRKHDMICRIGGDEFIILCSMLDTEKSEAHNKASIIAKRIVAAMQLPFVLDGSNARTIGISIGIRLVAPELCTLHDVLRDADVAMYYAKKSSKDKFHFFDNTTPPITTPTVRTEIQALL